MEGKSLEMSDEGLAIIHESVAALRFNLQSAIADPL
jgi:hypothetical protein